MDTTVAATLGQDPIGLQGTSYSLELEPKSTGGPCWMQQERHLSIGVGGPVSPDLALKGLTIMN